MSSDLRPAAEPSRKRSLIVPVTLLGVIAMSLSACKKEVESVETVSFPDRETCLEGSKAEDSWWLGEECSSAYIEARKAHLKEAPVYESRRLCETIHVGDCEGWTGAKGEQIFAPAMAGFMIGNIWQQRTQGLATRPLYARKDDEEHLFTPQEERVLKDFSKTLKTTVTAFRESNRPRQTNTVKSFLMQETSKGVTSSPGGGGGRGFGGSRTSSGG